MFVLITCDTASVIIQERRNGSGATVQCGTIELQAQLDNDFDKGLYRDAGYVYGPSRPRTLFFGIKAGI
ncbi:MAG: hypothetical protein PF588_04725 [Candidatus Kapabacteria bacterium]|nr:hypothetical protein [Candidatus Kapabacteria bacterium]